MAFGDVSETDYGHKIVWRSLRIIPLGNMKSSICY
jgi:hypothetical protein